MTARVMLLAAALALGACQRGRTMPDPHLTLESVDTKSCLPTLPIPNRPPFAIRSERASNGDLLVHLQQVPDAQPTPPFDVGIDGTTLHIVVAPVQLVDGTTFCDLVVRVTDVPATVKMIWVEHRNPDGKHIRILGKAPI